MASFNDILVTVLLVLGAILIAFLIALCIKLLYTVDKTNIILKDIEKKLKSVNGIFTAIDTFTDAVVTISDTFVGKMITLFEKIFKRKSKEENYEEK